MRSFARIAKDTVLRTRDGGHSWDTAYSLTLPDGGPIGPADVGCAGSGAYVLFHDGAAAALPLHCDVKVGRARCRRDVSDVEVELLALAERREEVDADEIRTCVDPRLAARRAVTRRHRDAVPQRGVRVRGQRS